MNSRRGYWWCWVFVVGWHGGDVEVGDDVEGVCVCGCGSGSGVVAVSGVPVVVLGVVIVVALVVANTVAVVIIGERVVSWRLVSFMLVTQVLLVFLLACVPGVCVCVMVVFDDAGVSLLLLRFYWSLLLGIYVSVGRRKVRTNSRTTISCQ